LLTQIKKIDININPLSFKANKIIGAGSTELQREDIKLINLNEDERRGFVINEANRFFSDFSDEPTVTKVFCWERAVNMEYPGQFPVIQDLLKNHMRDVGSLHLARKYLFLIASTEGTLAIGKKAAEIVT
jgi:oxygen-dependent protoporphyrinogen oxidase